jgi:polysaccharide export outer membrane protein
MPVERMQNGWKILASLVILIASVWSQTANDIPQKQASPAGGDLSSFARGGIHWLKGFHSHEPTEDAPGGPSIPTRAAGTDNFVIGNDDVLAINVWKEADISRVVPVRTDGKISLPLVGELQAAGKTPKQLEAEIGNGLKSYITEPEVTVIVQETKSQKFNILGHVQKPGSYVLIPPMTVVDAIAVAGGFQDFAKVKSIYVLRDDGGKQVRLPFNYKQVIKGSHFGQNIQLQPRDTVVVP